MYFYIFKFCELQLSLSPVSSLKTGFALRMTLTSNIVWTLDWINEATEVMLGNS